MNDRYLRAGLTGNPFAVAPPSGPPPEAFVSRGLPDPPTEAANTFVQIIGDQGFGKSTHVHHWKSLASDPYHYIVKRPYWRRWKLPPIAPVAYGDEIDRMPRPLRWCWFRQLSQRNATLIIGTHRDLENAARKAGFGTCFTHWLEPMDEEVLRRVLQRRLECSSANNGRPTFQFSDADISRIFSESQGIPREADAISHKVLAERIG